MIATLKRRNKLVYEHERFFFLIQCTMSCARLRLTKLVAAVFSRDRTFRIFLSIDFVSPLTGRPVYTLREIVDTLMENPKERCVVLTEKRGCTMISTASVDSDGNNLFLRKLLPHPIDQCESPVVKQKVLGANRLLTSAPQNLVGRVSITGNCAITFFRTLKILIDVIDQVSIKETNTAETTLRLVWGLDSGSATTNRQTNAQFYTSLS